MRPSSLLLSALLLAGCSGAGTTTSSVASPAVTPSSTPSSTITAGPADPLSPGPPVEAPAPTPTGATCDPARLTVTDADLLADEHQLQEVFVVRTSGPPCRLLGWPHVTLLGADDAALRPATRRTGSAVELALTRATSLSFVLSTPRTSDCQEVAAVVVTLPGTTRAIRTGTTMQLCHGQLGVGPVERRQDSEGAQH